MTQQPAGDENTIEVGVGPGPRTVRMRRPLFEHVARKHQLALWPGRQSIHLCVDGVVLFVTLMINQENFLIHMLSLRPEQLEQLEPEVFRLWQTEARPFPMKEFVAKFSTDLQQADNDPKKVN